jgi:hypothetical protein
VWLSVAVDVRVALRVGELVLERVTVGVTKDVVVRVGVLL